MMLAVAAFILSVFVVGCSDSMTTDPMDSVNNQTRGNQSSWKYELSATVKVNGEKSPLETAVNVGDAVVVTYTLKNIDSSAFPQVTVWENGVEKVKKTSVSKNQTLSYTYTVNTSALKENAASKIEFWDRKDNKNQAFEFTTSLEVAIAVTDVEVESEPNPNYEENILKFFEEAQKWFDQMVAETGEKRIWNHPSQGVINIHGLTLHLMATFGHKAGQTTGHFLCNEIEGNFYHLVTNPSYAPNDIQIEYTQYNPRLVLSKTYTHDLGGTFCVENGCWNIVTTAGEICEDCLVPAPVYYPVQLISSSKFANSTVGVHPLTTRPHTNGAAVNGTFSGNVNGFSFKVEVGQTLDRNFWDAVYAAYAKDINTYSSDVTPENVTLWFTGGVAPGVASGAYPEMVVTAGMLGNGGTILYLNPMLDAMQIVEGNVMEIFEVSKVWFEKMKVATGETKLDASGAITLLALVANIRETLGYAAHPQSGAFFKCNVTEGLFYQMSQNASLTRPNKIQLSYRSSSAVSGGIKSWTYDLNTGELNPLW